MMRVVATKEVDEVGRVVVPREVRKELNIEPGGMLDICIDDNGQIVLRRTMPCCKICGKTENLAIISGKNFSVCVICKKAIAAA